MTRISINIIKQHVASKLNAKERGLLNKFLQQAEEDERALQAYQHQEWLQLLAEERRTGMYY